MSAFVVEKGAPGFSVGKKEKKMGIRGSPTVELMFDNCEVPVENRLGDVRGRLARAHVLEELLWRDAEVSGVPGSHHPQYIDVIHREHAVVETDGVRTAKSMGLRNLPSKTWRVNYGWVLAANIAADLTCWTRLLGLEGEADLADAEVETLRFRLWHIPARLAAHARDRILHIPVDWPWAEAFQTIATCDRTAFY